MTKVRKLTIALPSAVLLVALCGPVVTGQQAAQTNAPRVGYVYPAGGQQGTTVRVIVAGQFLDGATSVVVSEPGVRGSIVTLDKPLNQKQITELRDQIQQMQPKAAADPAIRQQLVTLRAQLGDSVQRNRNPGLSDRVTIDVSIEDHAAPGQRQLRLATPVGLSNPVAFVVGQLPEARERDVKNNRSDAELPVTLPVTVNGRLIPGDVDNLRQPLRQPNQYMPGDVDRYRFAARRGQSLVVAVSARDLMPYLADAVPGWLQAVVTLYDATGREVGYCDDYRFHPDPVLHYEIPADGEYVAEIRDAIFRGREDFVYRITIGEVPFITSIFPLGGTVGAKTPIELTGWNLPEPRTTIRAGAEPGTQPVSARTGTMESNRVPFAIDTLPERLEREPNNATNDAQLMALPVIVNGQIRQPGDWDVFSFKGRAGGSVVAEVTARRLESPLDSVLELTDAAGRRVAFGDDHTDGGDGLLTHHADAYLRAALPADGVYFIRIGDIQHKGGPEYAYRLRLSAPQPDFALRISPSAINAASAANTVVTVTAIRHDGFTGDITLAFKGAPAGFDTSGALIPAGQDQIRFTVSAPPVATREPMHLRVEGRALIAGRTVAREAEPADERMQAFAYRHLVPADDLQMSVSGRGGTRTPIRLQITQPVTIPVGGATRIYAMLPPAMQTFEHIQLELSEPPTGVTLTDASVRGTQVEFLLRADAKATLGLRSNLIIVVSGERVPAANAQAPAQRRRVPIGVLPALAFEIGRERP